MKNKISIRAKYVPYFKWYEVNASLCGYPEIRGICGVRAWGFATKEEARAYGRKRMIELLSDAVGPPIIPEGAIIWDEVPKT